MQYTVWSRGRLLGETDLGFIYRENRHRCGWFHPNDLGEQLMPAAVGVAPAMRVEWAIGPVRLVSIPGEAFHALGRAIEDRVREDPAGNGAHVLLAGLAPEWHGYLPSPFRDGYEESTSYGRDAVATIAAALTG